MVTLPLTPSGRVTTTVAFSPYVMFSTVIFNDGVALFTLNNLEFVAL